MKMKRYFAADARQALKELRDDQGPDAVILSNRRVDGGVEIIAALEELDAASDVEVIVTDAGAEIRWANSISSSNSSLSSPSCPGSRVRSATEPRQPVVIDTDDGSEATL